jgi:hypothetical protein
MTTALVMSPHVALAIKSLKLEGPRWLKGMRKLQLFSWRTDNEFLRNRP